MTTEKDEIASEQRYIDGAYQRLELMRQRAEAIAEDLLPRSQGGTFNSRVNRDALVDTSLKRVHTLDIGEEALVFGRTDAAEDTHYIGRFAVHDDTYEPLVIDWRAPVAEAFYRATAVNPMGITRRRHFISRGRKIVGLDDELLDRKAADGLVLLGEAALFDALTRARTGRMRDIVGTIQAEQDEIIRAPIRGVTLVQGGPGTGKTAVALHRAAYLLYTHRKKLMADGVLLIGPNPIFIRYIERVLPALGEQDVVYTTPATITGGVSTSEVDSEEATQAKSDLRMAEVIRRGVASRQKPLEAALELSYENVDIRLTEKESQTIVDSVRRRRGTHNARGKALAKLVLAKLWRKYRNRRPPVSATGLSPQEEERMTTLDLAEHEEVAAAIDRMWPLLSPQQFVWDLLSTNELDAAAKDVLSASEIEAIRRSKSSKPTWGETDVPLLDESLGLLGPLPTPPKSRRDDTTQRAWLDQVMDQLQEFNPVDKGMRYAIENQLVERYWDDGREETSPRAEFGHVLVDEAQDVSPMQWRMIARRCPSGSMTIVGDLGQGSKAWSPTNWDQVLEHFDSSETRVEHLTINYRTPAEVMDFASKLLQRSAPGLEPPTSVRQSGEPPVITFCDSPSLPGKVAAAVRRARSKAPEGKVAVIAPQELLEELSESLGDQQVTAGSDPGVLDAPVALFNVTQTKGLEFDAVVVVEPAAIAGETDRGLRSLYVALTRTTQLLEVVHSKPLPEPLGV